MTPSVLAIGLLVAFVCVVWAAMMLWGLICPPVVSPPERCKRSRAPSLPLTVTEKSLVRQQGDAMFPVVIMPEAPAVAAVELPDDDKIVSLSQWRERRARSG